MGDKQRISYLPLEAMDDEMRAEMDRCRREGTPRPESSAVRAHVPACFWAFARSWETIFRDGVCDHAVKELCRVYVSRTVKCEYCGNQRSEKARAQGLTEARYDDLLNFESSARLSEREKAALAYAEAITWRLDTDDAFWERLHRHFSEPELVELGCFIALTMGQQSWLRLLNIEHHEVLAGTAASMAPGFGTAEELAAAKAADDYWAHKPARGLCAVADDDPAAAVARIYQGFARHEAGGRSAAYASLAESVAADAALTRFVASLPRAKRQPQLLFAAARYLLGAPPGIGSLRELASQSEAKLTQVMLTRRTQTNEPARCAVLLPALAQLPPPLALVEAGASAGLTMLFDRYSYDYAGYRLTGRDPDAPVLRCEPRGPVPLPPRIPEIAWRAGLDLNPLDVTSDEDVRWLSCLVWPGEGDRARRLAAAIATARRDPPAVYRGDMLTDLPALAARAPAEATLVVYHSSVLWYVRPDQREGFADTVRGLGAAWLSSEPPGVVPGTTGPSGDELLCVLARDGRALGFADSHGTWLQWLPPAGAAG